MSKKYRAVTAVVAAVWILIIVFILITLSRGEAVHTDTSGSITITEKTQNSGNENLTIDIRLPVISGLSDDGFESALNVMIDTQVSKALEYAKEAADEFWREAKDEGFEPWPYTFYADYELKSNEGILSLKVTTLLYTGGPGMPKTVCYNADIENNKLLTLGDLFKNDAYKESINAVIETEMDKDAERYLGDEPFFGVSDKTKFFISEGKLYITFAKYEVASGMTGEPEFLIPTDKIRGVLKREYRGVFR